jgi:hypothetical protein
MAARKEAMVCQPGKDRKVYLVALRLRHEVGAVANLSGLLEKRRFSILSGFVSSPDEDGYGQCSFFVEASPYARDVVVKAPHKGILIDSLNFPLAWNTGDSAVMLRTHFFSVMEDGIRKVLDSGADVLLYQLGHHHGAPSWRNLLREYSVEDKRDLEVALGFYGAVGWGRTNVASFDPARKTATVKIWDNFECLTKAPGARQGSNFVRGDLAGISRVRGARGEGVGDEVPVAGRRALRVLSHGLRPP